MNETIKGAAQSWTVWFNSFVAGFGVLAASTDALKGVVPEKYFPLVVAFVAAVNVALRFKTTESLGDKGA